MIENNAEKIFSVSLLCVVILWYDVKKNVLLRVHLVL